MADTVRAWTPGPWEPDKDAAWMIQNAGKNLAVSIWDGQAETKDPWQANARLISASPDFADGTEDFIAYEKAMDDGDDVRAMLFYASASKKLRAAMNKALGVNGG